MVAGRPQIHLYGVLDGGEPALVVDTRCRPYFFARRQDVDRARAVLARVPTHETSLVTFADEPVVRIEVPAPADLPILRRRLGDVGVRTFEADVRFAYRYLDRKSTRLNSSHLGISYA